MLEAQDIVCLSVTFWEKDSRSRYQHLMTRFSQKNRILYVEPPVSIPYLFILPEYRNSFFRWMAGPRPFSSNIHIISLPPSMPLKGIWRGFNRLSSIWAWPVIKRALSCLGIRNPLVYGVSPYYIDLIKRIKPPFLIYDCADDHSEVKGRSRELILRMEKEMVSLSNCSFASSERIYLKLKGYSERVFLLRNGADVRHFSIAMEDGTWIPEEIKGLKRPIIGFIGCFRDGVIDFKLLESLRERIKGTILLVGPNQLWKERPIFFHLIKRERVKWVGYRSYGLLPHYLKAMDCCLIPYRVNNYMMSVFPLKLMEYLAGGKPVVSVDIPEVRRFQEVVYVSKSLEEFMRNTDRAILEDSHEKRMMRQRVAMDYDWDRIARMMEDMISLSLKGK
jgi:glycosyltransferase involved in cell wall biosynthesis